jgi:hypothetical protein
MLAEVPDVVQDAPGLRRRWFRDDYFDLYLWEAPGGRIDAFQLCYDRAGRERILRWTQKAGYRHEGVDRPETKPGRAMTAILVGESTMPVAAVTKKLLGAATGLPAAVRNFLFARLKDYGRAPGKRGRAPRKAPRHGGR